MVDFQSIKDGPFCFLLTYKDDGSKFGDNAALTSKRQSQRMGQSQRMRRGRQSLQLLPSLLPSLLLSLGGIYH